MIRLETINFIRLIITGLLAYIPIVTIAGYFSAWLAKKIGDDTAQKEGYLTLNPINHLDFVSMAMTILFMPYIGFSKGVPLNLNNMQFTKLKNIKTFLLLFVNATGFLIVLAFASLVSILIHAKIIPIINSNHQISSLTIVLISILKMIFGITIFLIFIHLVGAIIRAFFHFYAPELENNSNYLLFRLFFSFAIVILFGSYIEYFIILYKLNIDKFFSYLFL